MYNNRQAYAPTPHSYIPNTTLSATINLDEEVKLASSRAERDLQDSLAEVFSIIITLDELEKAHRKDAIPEAEYTETCDRLLKQYKAIISDETVAKQFVDLETFKYEWDMVVPRATQLIQTGLPSTVTAASHAPQAQSSGYNTRNNQYQSGSSAPNGTLILEATQDFITFLDALKLQLLAKDQLHPLLSDVIQSVNKVTDRDFEGRGKIVQWLIRLNQMKASESLGDEEARELELDMNGAYGGFKATLG